MDKNTYQEKSSSGSFRMHSVDLSNDQDGTMKQEWHNLIERINNTAW